jgi:3-deoxy-D-manno-octulosonate 8-phosphate phosphatase (KDO 8-P phosphatase)
VPEIKAVALDVDGVLTDGSFTWGPGGEEYKTFCFLDIMGISLGKKSGLVFALISGEDTPLIDRYGSKMGIEDVYKGCKDKASALRDFAHKHGFDLAEVCFMGDDVNDVPAMQLAGLPAAPATAHAAARAQAKYVAAVGGGKGAVRELVDTILAGRSRKQE